MGNSTSTLRFGKKSIEELKAYAVSNDLSLMEALGILIDEKKIVKKSVVSFYERIMDLHDTYMGYSAKDLAGKVLDIGYRESLENDVDQTKLDNVSELLNTIAVMEEENMEPIPLEDLLAHFALFSAQDDDTGKNVVRIMTIHTAKGLEFPVVFIPGMVDGQFPSKKLHNRDELEEERRLFYVAITRAMKELYISSYRNKVEGYPTRASYFMEDIDYKLLEYCGEKKQERMVEVQVLPEKTNFQVGDEVMHPAFGKGTVAKVNMSRQYYEIYFEKLASNRQIVFRANLIPVEE